MTLAARAEAGAPPPKARGSRCRVGVLIASLPEGEQEALRLILSEDSGWTGAAIHEALVDEGLDTPAQKSIERHRRHDCACL